MSIWSQHFVLIATVCAVSGCQSGMKLGSTGGLYGGARENPAPTDPWVEDAGKIARHEHPPEEVIDPLGLRNIFMSEKARDIERNLGVGE